MHISTINGHALNMMLCSPFVCVHVIQRKGMHTCNSLRGFSFLLLHVHVYAVVNNWSGQCPKHHKLFARTHQNDSLYKHAHENERHALSNVFWHANTFKPAVHLRSSVGLCSALLQNMLTQNTQQVNVWRINSRLHIYRKTWITV